MWRAKTKAMTPAINDFWALLARIYKNRDRTRDASNKIIQLCDELDELDSGENPKESGEITSAKIILAMAQIEVNNILSYAHELEPHLKDQGSFRDLAEKASILFVLMRALRTHTLKDISNRLRAFAEASNYLSISPTKNSIKQAFGFDVGNEYARVKTYLENNYSKY